MLEFSLYMCVINDVKPESLICDARIQCSTSGQSRAGTVLYLKLSFWVCHSIVLWTDGLWVKCGSADVRVRLV